MRRLTILIPICPREHFVGYTRAYMFFEGSSELSATARTEILNISNTNFVSPISFWEIAIKMSIGKMTMDLTMNDLQRLVWENGIEILPLKIEHTFQVQALACHHKDSFDRILFAQALTENMKL